MALSANRAGVYFRSAIGGVGDGTATGHMQIATGQLIYKGGLVSTVDASGYMVEAGDTAGHSFVGLAIDGTDGNTTTSNGQRQTRVIREGSVLLNMTGATQANIGAAAYVVDDDTCALVGTTTNDVRIGVIVELGTAANTVWVSFNTAQ